MNQWAATVRGTDVHDKNTGLVELIDDFLGWDTDSTDKQLCLFLDNDINEFIEFTLGVVVVCLSCVGSEGGD